MSRNCCDYGCDRSFNCPAGSRPTCTKSQTERNAWLHPCDRLGVCQDRTPRCVGCDTARAFPFAPGVLNGPHRRPILTARRANAIGRAALFVAVLAGVVGVCGFIAGYAQGGGLLP